jgi:cysteine desulfurase/selenocysteine lyase
MSNLKIQKDFPILNNPHLVYLDSAASSLKPLSVIEKMDEYYKTYGVNVHRGVYDLSFRASEAYDQARQTVADFINADFEEVVFTRGASNSLNMVARGLRNTIQKDDEIIVSVLEHHSNLLPWQELAKDKGAKIVYFEPDSNKRLSVETLERLITPKTKVLAINYVSNTFGYIAPVKDMVNLTDQYGIISVIDAAQAVPHKNVNVKDLDCDFLAFSGHKMCGPTGIGVLYGKKNVLDKLEPSEYGGGMMVDVSKEGSTFKDLPERLETGTPPIAEAIGLGEAIRYLTQIGFEQILKHEQALQRYTVNALNAIDGVTVYNEDADTGIILFNLDGVHSHDAISALEEHNICARAGHHCAQLALKHYDLNTTLRVSFYLYNTIEECDLFIEAVKYARHMMTELGF